MWQDRSLTVDREGLKIVRPPQEFAMNIIGQKKEKEPLFQDECGIVMAGFMRQHV